MWREFYAATPSRAIPLEELEEAGLLRLRVLRVLSTTPNAERLFRSVQDLPQDARTALERLDADCDLDCVAHFSLRLASCLDNDRLAWLVDSEARLMTLRLHHLPSDDILRMLASVGQQMGVCDSDQIQAMVNGAQWQWLAQVTQPHERYCLVPFNVALKLVGSRQVVLNRGQCLLQINKLYHVVVHHFKMALHVQLLSLYRSLPAKRQTMERLKEVVNHIHASWMGTPTTTNHFLHARLTAEVTLSNIDDVAKQHFPMCMKHLHKKLRENHHLKFDGRVQYRVFLKGLGFSVHDTILFFRDEFTKVTPAAKFDREYAYHIRHSYGLEGSRKDYAPMDCQKIIHGGIPKHGQFHGCPFKHWDPMTLQHELRSMGVSPGEADFITQTASHGFHEQACATLFGVMHRRPFQVVEQIEGVESPVRMHPNEWVRASITGG